MKKNISRWVGWSVGLYAALLLAACGGGGDDASTSAPGSASAGSTTGQNALASPQAPSASAPTAADDDGNPFTNPPGTNTAGSPLAKQDCGISNLASDIVALLNAERARGASCGSRGSYSPTGSLQWNTTLESAAIGHSQDMAANNLFSHVSSNGGNLAVRVDATGYEWLLLGENIAGGFSNASATVAAWMASDGHCANVMNPQFQDIALACVPGTAATQYQSYWTLDFGTPR
jgi:uncharacterized protein YkwD